MVGDADTVRPAHAVELFGLLGGGKADSAMGNLPNAQLAVLPGTTEPGMLARVDLLTAIITPFLDALHVYGQVIWPRGEDALYHSMPFP